MENRETIQKRKTVLDSVIEAILREYPMINPKDILRFSLVHYPIAEIEIDFDEKVFEDFETVHITVLRLIALGHKSCDAIAALMGLTTLYVERVANMLCSIGHIDTNFNLTALGLESLEQGKKITTVRVAQAFQLDPLALNLVRLDKTVSRKKIINTNDMSSDVLVFDCADEISKEHIINKLQDNEFRQIMASKNKALNVNVTKIHGISVQEIKYVQAYILKLNNREPIVFSERENFQKKGHERYSWLPFACIDPLTAEFLNVKDLPIYPAEIAQKILASVNRLEAETSTDITIAKVQSVITGILDKEEYAFDKQHVQCDYNNRTIVIKSKHAFTRANSKTVHLLKILADNGVSVATSINLRGLVVKIFTEDQEILNALKKLNLILKQQGSKSEKVNIDMFAKKIENEAKTSNIIDIIYNYELK